LVHQTPEMTRHRNQQRKIYDKTIAGKAYDLMVEKISNKYPELK